MIHAFRKTKTATVADKANWHVHAAKAFIASRTHKEAVSMTASESDTTGAGNVDGTPADATSQARSRTGSVNAAGVSCCRSCMNTGPQSGLTNVRVARRATTARDWFGDTACGYGDHSSGQP